jgi:hypothetical protein
VRGAEGHVVDTLLRFAVETFGQVLLDHAWADFWMSDGAPEEMMESPEFDSMFVPWFTLWFIANPRAGDARPNWPEEPMGLYWLRTENPDVSEIDRRYLHAACRSPLSAFVVLRVVPGRSVDVKDILTGRRFHTLEQGASRRLQAGDVLFTRVVTIDGVSVMCGAGPFIVPPSWHTHVIDWREDRFRRRLMTRDDLEEHDIEIRDLYFDITDEILDPTPPALCNTDGDPFEMTTVRYDLKVPVGEAFEALKTLAMLPDEEHFDEPIFDESGAMTAVELRWVKAGNSQHTHWTNTTLATITLEPGRLTAALNSARRADAFGREMAKCLGSRATLVSRDVTDLNEALDSRAIAREAGALDEPAEIEKTPEILEIEEDLFRQHFESWIDTRLPVLRDRTPREASRTDAGRERLEALLAGFERLQPERRAHFVVLRRTLGLPETE